MTEKIYVGYRFKCDKNGTNEFKIIASGHDKAKVKAETISKAQDYLDDDLWHLLSSDSLSAVLREVNYPPPKGSGFPPLAPLRCFDETEDWRYLLVRVSA